MNAKLMSERTSILIELKSTMKIVRFLHETYKQIFEEYDIDVPAEKFGQALIDRVTNFMVTQAPDLALQEQEKIDDEPAGEEQDN